MEEKIIKVYTDGACSGNPGPGGWGAVLCVGETKQRISGGEKSTTNNRMELLAAIKALESLPQGGTVEVYTDSEYLRKGITQWIQNWKKNQWKTASKSPVKNQDLWKQLDSLREQHQVSWFWVKGHQGNLLNEEADSLARNAIP